MDEVRERQEDVFLQDVRLLPRRGAGVGGEDVEVGWGVEVVVAEFGPPGEEGPGGEAGWGAVV